MLLGFRDEEGSRGVDKWGVKFNAIKSDEGREGRNQWSVMRKMIWAKMRWDYGIWWMHVCREWQHRKISYSWLMVWNLHVVMCRGRECNVLGMILKEFMMYVCLLCKEKRWCCLLLSSLHDACMLHVACLIIFQITRSTCLWEDRT